MRTAISDFLSVLSQGGLPYHAHPERNVMVLTSLSTLKPTYAIPMTILNGVRALEEKAECLIVDFHGLKGFSGRQIGETLKNTWPHLRSHRAEFPDPYAERAGLPAKRVEQYPEMMARGLENPEVRAHLAEAIRPHLEKADYVGLPAVLGVQHTDEVFHDLQDRLERPLFEIPIMPPSVAGLRLSNLFGEALPRLGARAFFHHPVLKAERGRGNGFRFEVGQGPAQMVVRAQAAVLAGGRFLGGGLYADRERVVEPLFGLPVYQLQDRNRWHRQSYLDPRGHPINRFGLETDALFRPLNADGQPAFPMLFAAGSILAHQDWMRMKCGSGLAITTAYAAVRAFEQLR
jgi:glycerol-3-phosphate dehydrogenase subunit B